MLTDPAPGTASTRSHRPRALTVFAAAFIAGAAAAVAVNSVLDVRLAQAKPQVASEPIFVALRSLPQGAPVTVWDVALRDWPRAMVPTSALRASDTFSGLVLKHPLREGQPLLSIQLVEADAAPSSRLSVTAVSTPPAAVARTADVDLWAPAEPTRGTPSAAVTSQQPQQAQSIPQAEPPATQSGQSGDGPAARLPEQARIVPPVTAAETEAPAVEPVTQPVPATPAVAAELPQPPADEAIAVESSGTPAAADVAMPAPMVSESTAGLDDAVTDEMLEALAATSVSVDSLIAPPSASVFDSTAADADAPFVDDQPQPAPQPTLADPPIVPIEPLADASATPASVMQQPGSMTQPTAAPAPTRIATRYLVVPENIALQADASFTATRQPEPQPAPRQPQGNTASAIKPLPPTATSQSASRPGSQPAQPRTGRTQRGNPAAVSPQGRPSSPGATTGAAVRPQPQREPMFPNIAAGIETLEGEMGRMRRERSGQAEPPASARPRPKY